MTGGHMEFYICHILIDITGLSLLGLFAWPQLVSLISLYAAIIIIIIIIMPVCHHQQK